MRYSITVSAVPDQKTAKILARYITSRGDQTSFSELIDMLQTEEYRYAYNITKSEMQAIKDQLEAINVRIRIEEIEEQPLQTEQKSYQTEEIIDSSDVIPQTSSIPKDIDEQNTPHVNLDTTKKSEEKVSKRKKIHIIVSLSTLIFIILILATLLLNFNSEDRFSVNESNQMRLESSSNSQSGANSAPSEQPFENNESSQDRLSREALTSADKQCVSSGINTEKFYQFAIDYNPNNLDAWFGLLNCYHSTRRFDDANRVISLMSQQFGNNILEPARYLSEFGNIEVSKLQSPNGSLVYQSNTNSINMLYGELFRMTRRISAAGTVKSLTILAKMKNGTGIFMTISLGSCIEYYDFIEQGTFQEMQ